MPATPEELSEIVDRLNREHGEPAVAIVSMVVFYTNLGAQFPIKSVSDAHRTTLTLAIAALARERGISHAALLAAFEALKRAGSTITELMSLPD